MKRLLGLLLVMGMVGCGGGGDAPPAGEAALQATPENAQAKVDEPPVQTVDASKLVERDGLWYEDDSETPFTGVAVDKHENGKKKSETPYKNGKKDGLSTGWYKNGQKRAEVTYKDGKRWGRNTSYHENGKKVLEIFWKDRKMLSVKSWDDAGK